MREHTQLSAPASTVQAVLVSGAILIAVLGVLLPASPARASWRARADSLFAEADRQFSLGSHSDAATLFQRTIETIESNAAPSPATYFSNQAARARFLKARSNEHLEQWGEALNGYAACLVELS